MGTKIILAFIVFFLASVLVGRSARFEPLRRDRKKWLVITIVVAFIIVAYLELLANPRYSRHHAGRIVGQAARLPLKREG